MVDPIGIPDDLFYGGKDFLDLLERIGSNKLDRIDY
jgi:hypothetical protein